MLTCRCWRATSLDNILVKSMLSLEGLSARIFEKVSGVRRISRMIICSSQKTFFLEVASMSHNSQRNAGHRHLWTTQLTQWRRDKMAAIFQMTLSKWFSYMKIIVFWLKFHWNLFHRSNSLYSLVQIIAWWRTGDKLLSEAMSAFFTDAYMPNRWQAEQATNHYLKQCWHVLQTHICITRPQWVKSPMEPKLILSFHHDMYWFTLKWFNFFSVFQ